MKPNRNVPTVGRALATLAAVLLLAPGLSAQEPALLTPGEVNRWESLSTHAEVNAFYRELQARSPLVRTFHLGWSRERRELLALTVASPAVATPAEAHATGKPIVFIAAQVHGNEPAGKEGLMLFARDLALGPLRPLLDEVVFVLVPQINPDGAEADSVGTRANPTGYNLNRDYVQLGNPETRALISRGVARWEPHVLVDAHETFGPPRYYDFYTLHPRNPYGGAAIVELTEREVHPAIVDALAAAGFNHYFYHVVPRALMDTLSAAVARETPGEAALAGMPANLRGSLPPLTRGGDGARSLSSYGGPHGAITFLFESLRRPDPRPGIERRARMHHVAMEGLARYVAGNPDRVRDAVARAREEMIERGSRWDEADSIVVKWEAFVNRESPYRVWVGDRVVEVTVPVRDGRRPILSRVRPEGYLIEAHREDVARHLELHGIVVERTLEPVAVEVESFRVESVVRAEPFEGMLPRDVSTRLERRTVEFPAGSWIVRAGQRRAGLVFHMLEPEDGESLASAGWFINQEERGSLLPVHRIRGLPVVPTQVRTEGEPW
jgi:hypothetical protein